MKEQPMAQLVQVEAYLGPNRPETIAEAVLPIAEDRTHEDYHWGVVRQDRETGECSLLGIHTSEKAALGQFAYSHSNKGFGILTNIRTQPVTEGAQAEACS